MARHYAVVVGWCDRCHAWRSGCEVDIAYEEAYMDGDIVGLPQARATCTVCGERVRSRQLDQTNEAFWEDAAKRYRRGAYAGRRPVLYLRDAPGPSLDDYDG